MGGFVNKNNFQLIRLFKNKNFILDYCGLFEGLCCGDTEEIRDKILSIEPIQWLVTFKPSISQNNSATLSLEHDSYINFL